MFDALISRRPYKEPWDPQLAAAEVERGAGAQFDPAVVTAVLKLFREGRFNTIIRAAQEADAHSQKRILEESQYSFANQVSAKRVA